MAKSIAILGLGKYGRSLADSLYSMGIDTLVVDINPELVRLYSDRSTTAITADLRNEDEVKELGLKTMDAVIVCIGTSLEPSIMSVNVAKELGVPSVIAKVSSERMASILLRVGADRVINPEEEMGVRSARKLVSPSFLEYFELDEELCLVEVKAKDKWVGKSMKELDFRKQYHANVVSVREENVRWSFVDPDKPLKENSILLMMTNKKNLKGLSFSS
ncbi:MAG: TrkA family potassium uptake protein [Lachnospiraceae bacterium]|nr:TrkA family potassium uptake protein [Lachnospiraceae bacterium]